MKSVVKVAKTVDEAINEALIDLKVDREDVEIEIMEEPSRGLFGLIGLRDAIVKVTVVNDPVELIENFLEKLLMNMGIIASTEIIRQGENINVKIVDINPKDMGIVIGKRGSTLDSIQYLLSLAVNKEKEGYLKILLDVNDYRSKREETLTRLAKRMSDKAIRTKRPVKLEPMNPYERRIIHAALQDTKGIKTYSEGNEPYRRVVIQGRDNKPS